MPNLTPLTELMAALRHPETGCPWDIKQTSVSIASYTLEETYELLHAIESGDIEHTKEELGDLLFHIIFHAQIAAENQQFDINDVINAIVEKMTYRHPHVFDKDRDNQLNDEALKQQWASLKQKDKKETSRVLDDVAQKLPAMMRAQKLQDVAAEYCFDWPDAMPVLDKIEEEIAELREALIQGDQQHVRSEMGDILFACINLARHIEVDAESALRNTNEKFIHRFDYVVEQMQQSNTPFSPDQLQQMELFWQQSKSVTG
jgi:nucleoside triphosphate diphosphatase